MIYLNEDDKKDKNKDLQHFDANIWQGHTMGITETSILHIKVKNQMRYDMIRCLFRSIRAS